MRKYVEKTCITCSTVYEPTGPASKYCLPCSIQHDKENAKRGNDVYRTKQGRKVGVGSGNAQGKGEAHHSYKTGVGIFRRFVKDKCERCGSTTFLCVHHKDRNRNNNTPDNLETVCKRCHQIEHECWKAFEGVTTIPKGSTLK